MGRAKTGVWTDGGKGVDGNVFFLVENKTADSTSTSTSHFGTFNLHLLMYLGSKWQTENRQDWALVCGLPIGPKKASSRCTKEHKAPLLNTPRPWDVHTYRPYLGREAGVARNLARWPSCSDNSSRKSQHSSVPFDRQTYFWICHSRLSRGHTCRVLSHLEMQ